MKLQRFFLFSGALALVALNSGCDNKQEPKTYSVANPPSETPAAVHPSGGAPAAIPPGHPSVGPMKGAPAPDGKRAPEISSGTPPPHWEMQPPTPMRLASFLVKGEKGAMADISLILLNGAAGGVLDNVNRWQSQLGQPDFTADDLAKKAQHLQSPLGDMTVVDLQGLAPGADAVTDGRIIAAIVTHEGMAFFFKMRGNAELAGAQKADFIRWACTVRSGEVQTDTAAKAPASPQ